MNKRKRSKLLKPGSNALEGVRCDPANWLRFSPEMTEQSGGSEPFRGTVIDNFISRSVLAPWTHHDLVEAVSQHSTIPIAIESLASELRVIRGSRGCVVFGFSGDALDQVARNYPNMIWWVSAKGLNMQIVQSTRILLPPFDELVGKLMLQADARRAKNGRLTDEEFMAIAKSLDEKGFRPVEFLEGTARKELANWNQKHPRIAVHTFTSALERNIPGLRTKANVKRRFYRAAEKFRKAYRKNLSES